MAEFSNARRCQFMRAIQQNSGDENPFQKALQKKAQRKNRDPRSSGFAHHHARNARQMPTRRLQRGR
jgi:hypothetical protein